VLVIFAYRWVVRRTERRPVEELSWPGAASAVGRGAVVGVGVFAAVIAVIAHFGGYKVDRVQAVVYAYRRGLVS
jgi:hypothetical protein